MAIYAIGDVQGCFSSLQQLLEKISFDPSEDKLWFTGDLVNRGPDSLKTLRFVKHLVENNQAISVLGNHDLHLLAIHYGVETNKHENHLDDVLNAADKDELCDWLRHLPLLHHEHNFLLIHAGFPPQWDLNIAKQCAHELESMLSSEKAQDFFQHMYGNEPNHWDPQLTSWDRLRFITNCFTRIRYCDSQGHLDLTAKGPLNSQAKHLHPWFSIPNRQSKNLKIIFGHWAALHNHWDQLTEPDIFPLDSGCVWGNRLTALRLEDLHKFHVSCQKS